MPAYPLAQLQADQPCLWIPLVLPACLLACGASAGTHSTFEVSRFEGERNEAKIETFSIVHPEEAAKESAELSASPQDELLELAAAAVMGAYLHQTSGERIKRISRGEGGLWFYLQTANDDDEESLLIVIGSPDRDVHEVLRRATEQAEYAPCARRFAAAVAFKSGQAALRVLS